MFFFLVPVVFTPQKWAVTTACRAFCFSLETLVLLEAHLRSDLHLHVQSGVTRRSPPRDRPRKGWGHHPVSRAPLPT